MKKSLLIYSIANAVGLFLFFGVVAGIENEAKMERRDYYDIGDSLNFEFHAVPVFLLCLLLNTLWGARSLVAIFRRRSYQDLVIFGLVVAAWTALFLGFDLNPWPIFSLIIPAWR